jgi:hypothetical protein
MNTWCRWPRKIKIKFSASFRQDTMNFKSLLFNLLFVAEYSKSILAYTNTSCPKGTQDKQTIRGSFILHSHNSMSKPHPKDLFGILTTDTDLSKCVVLTIDTESASGRFQCLSMRHGGTFKFSMKVQGASIRFQLQDQTQSADSVEYRVYQFEHESHLVLNWCQSVNNVIDNRYWIFFDKHMSNEEKRLKMNDIIEHLEKDIVLSGFEFISREVMFITYCSCASFKGRIASFLDTGGQQEASSDWSFLFPVSLSILCGRRHFRCIIHHKGQLCAAQFLQEPKEPSSTGFR